MFQKWWQAVVLAAALTFFLLLWHYLLPSMLSGYDVKGMSGATVIEDAVRVHQSSLAFIRRPLCTWTIQFLVQNLGWSVAQSFTILNFILIFFCNILLYILAKLYLCSQREALLSQILFTVSFSVLFSFFAPVYTYDDPLQYFFILLSLVAIHFRSSLFIVPCIFLALATRETTFFLFLAFYALSIPQKEREQAFEDIKDIGLTDEELKGVNAIDMLVIDFASLIPLALSSIFFIYFVNTYFSGVQIEDTRFMCWVGNFQTMQFATETFCTLFMVLGLPFLITIYGDDDKHAILIRNLFFAIIVNTLAVLIMTKAREARLFALPLMLYFPIAGRLLLNTLAKINIKKIQFKLLFVLVFAIFAVFSFTMYYSTDSGGAFRYYQTYLFISLCLAFFLHQAVDDVEPIVATVESIEVLE